MVTSPVLFSPILPDCLRSRSRGLCGEEGGFIDRILTLLLSGCARSRSWKENNCRHQEKLISRSRAEY